MVISAIDARPPANAAITASCPSYMGGIPGGANGNSAQASRWKLSASSVIFPLLNALNTCRTSAIAVSSLFISDLQRTPASGAGSGSDIPRSHIPKIMHPIGQMQHTMPRTGSVHIAIFVARIARVQDDKPVRRLNATRKNFDQTALAVHRQYFRHVMAGVDFVQCGEGRRHHFQLACAMCGDGFRGAKPAVIVDFTAVDDNLAQRID